MYQPNNRRFNIFEKALINNGFVQENTNVVFNECGGVYSEVITEDVMKVISKTQEGYHNLPPLTLAKILAEEAIGSVLKSNGFEIDDSVDYESSDFYDGYEINVPFKKTTDVFNEEVLFTELDDVLNRQNRSEERSTINGIQKPDRGGLAVSTIGGRPKPTINQRKQSNVRRVKTQNPRKVDLLIKSVFESKFHDYTLSSDIGGWKPAKTLKNDGKLAITWENTDESSIIIETVIFPNDTNKIKIDVKSRTGEKYIDFMFEIYRIPTDAFLVEKFFRKSFFNLLKKFIDTRVIQLPPFNLNFVFWKTDNPFFSYSFSSPKKNKILKDLIAFISTARKPILDDFFEQNNLKHKQGYLQTLLDAAEAAGIFKFARIGNEIEILRGPNYKAFLEGKIRRAAS